MHLRPALLLLALALCFAPACRIAEAQAHNLRELHEESGRHKRVADLTTGLEYTFNQVLGAFVPGGAAKLAASKPVKIEDPLEKCVDNLIELSRIEPREESTAALQVEHFARYAVNDPWQISRQICARALGAAGARLERARFPPAAVSGPVATPEAVRDALAPLIRAVAPQARQPLESLAAAPASDLEGACRGMAELNYDLDGLLRALPASVFLLQHHAVDLNSRRLLLDLVRNLERRTVQIALDHALADSSPDVRAAALRGLVHANGPAYLAKHFPLLGTEPEREVQLAMLSMIRALGLPGAKSADAAGAQSEREGELALLYKVATVHPDEGVRVSAMATLGAVSGAGFQSLREEDWELWWYARTQPTAR
ncbi:MAG: hypothetical protein ABI054_13865 [Planctomycetota bacterium]